MLFILIAFPCKADRVSRMPQPFFASSGHKLSLLYKHDSAAAEGVCCLDAAALWLQQSRRSMVIVHAAYTGTPLGIARGKVNQRQRKKDRPPLLVKLSGLGMQEVAQGCWGSRTDWVCGASGRPGDLCVDWLNRKMSCCMWLFVSAPDAPCWSRWVCPPTISSTCCAGTLVPNLAKGAQILPRSRAGTSELRCRFRPCQSICTKRRGMQTCRCALLIVFTVLSSRLWADLLKITCMHF